MLTNPIFIAFILLTSSSTFSTVPLTDKNIDINVLLYLIKVYHITIKKIYAVFNDKLEHEPH